MLELQNLRLNLQKVGLCAITHIKTVLDKWIRRFRKRGAEPYQTLGITIYFLQGVKISRIGKRYLYCCVQLRYVDV